ncbi:MAG TPA: EthD domain-containing protein [Acidimicrobiia bacterium]|jgi:hypothetical protein|nr:EthD domain-containing protein [Acidimicrobiia bacterium]
MAIKLVGLLRRREDVPPEEFRRYWLEEHGPLVRSIVEAAGVKRYVQSHTLDTELNAGVASGRAAVEPFDGVVEVWFEGSLEDMGALLGNEDFQRANAVLIEDESKFIDPARSSFFLTQEHILLDK